jgi:hypothetical protein
MKEIDPFVYSNEEKTTEFSHGSSKSPVMELLIEPELFYELCQGLESVANSHCYRGLFRVRLRGEAGLILRVGAVVVEACLEDGDAVEYGFGTWTFDQEAEERLWEFSKGWAKVE